VRKEFLIDMIHRYFLLYLPPCPLGTPPPTEEGNWDTLFTLCRNTHFIHTRKKEINSANG